MNTLKAVSLRSSDISPAAEGGAEAFAGKDSASDSQDESGLLDFYRTMQNAKEAVPVVKDSEKTKSSGIGSDAK